jgi:hypothetical protein
MTTPTLRQSWVVSCALTLLAASASAQWSSNPAQNLAVGNRTGDQVQPKVVSTSDGGCYISWFDNFSGGYDVYLQRLDARGYEQWPHNGILIANRSYSSTTDYGLAVDGEDNAILAYNDDRGGSDQIGANKIAPAGTLLWGPAGVLLTNTTEYVASPQVAVTSDGNYVVGWSQNGSVVLRKLSAFGTPQWTPAVRLIPPTGAYYFSYIIGSDDGAVIVLWVHQIGTFYSNKYLYAQKVSPTGTMLWGAAPVIVYDGGSVQFGYFPTFVTDGQGGAVFGWYETSGSRNCYFQHVNYLGSEVYPHNGVAASTLANRIRMSPCVLYNTVSAETFLFWTESNSTQTQWGLYGQKFSPNAGTRQWTDSGRALIPLSGQQNSFVRAVLCADGAMVFCFDQSGSAHVLAMRLDGAGNFVWPGSPLQACSLLSSKSRLDVTTTPSGMALLSWSDGRTDGGSIYAQNVNPSGSFGLPAFIFDDLNCDGVVNFDDINPFVLALTNPTGYQNQYPNCNIAHGDANRDGVVDFDDIDAFIAILSGGN